MRNSLHFDTISGGMVNSIPPQKKDEVRIRSKSPKIQELAKKITIKGGFQGVRPSDGTPYGSLLAETSWTTTSSMNQNQLRVICAVATEESSSGVLKARSNLLASKHAMDLRFDIRLTINLWLQWNTTTPGKAKPFSYWDQCPDRVDDFVGVYTGEVSQRISELQAEDAMLLKELGNTLVKFPALTNNRDAPTAQRVISAEAKSMIDGVLEVGLA